MPTIPSIKVRITNIDQALVAAGPLDNTNIKKVPIIRIYGQSSSGCKACVHVHQVYPYFYVEYKGKIDPATVSAHIKRLTTSINNAMSISLKRNDNDNRKSPSRYVRSLCLVKAVPFYGFHAAYAPYLKVHIVDPQHMQRLVTLLQSGSILQTKFKIHESHLSYQLQFMSDFGLYGCGEIELGDIYVREKRASDNDPENLQSSFNPSNFPVSPHPRESHLPIELDVTAPHILNRQLLAPRNIHHKLTIPAEVMSDEPLVLSVRELWEDERKRRAHKGLNPTPIMPSDGTERRGEGPIWRAEPRLKVELEKRIAEEQTSRDERPKVALDAQKWEKYVMTSFESIEALWPVEERSWKPEDTQELAPSASPFEVADEDLRDVWPQSPSRAQHLTNEDIDSEFIASQAMKDMVQDAESRKMFDDDPGSDEEQPEPQDTSTKLADELEVSRPATPSPLPSISHDFELPPTPNNVTPTKTRFLQSIRPTNFYPARTPSRATSVLSEASSFNRSRESSPASAKSSPVKRLNPFSEPGWSGGSKGRGMTTPSRLNELTPTRNRTNPRRHLSLSVQPHQRPITSSRKGSPAPQPIKQLVISKDGILPEPKSDHFHFQATEIDPRAQVVDVAISCPPTEIDPRIHDPAWATPPEALLDQRGGDTQPSPRTSSQSVPGHSSQPMPSPGQKPPTAEAEHSSQTDERSQESNEVMCSQAQDPSLPERKTSPVEEELNEYNLTTPTKTKTRPSTQTLQGNNSIMHELDLPSYLESNGDAIPSVKLSDLSEDRSQPISVLGYEGKIVKKRKVQVVLDLPDSTPESQNGLDPVSSLSSVHCSSLHPLSSTAFVYSFPAPTTEFLLASLSGIPEKHYQDPYFSNAKDVPKHSREWGGNVFHLGRNGVRSGVGGLQEWQMGEGSGCPQWSVSEIKGMSHNPDEDEEEDEFLREARRKERLDFNAIRKELTKIATGRDKGLTLPHKPKLDGANVTGWEYVHVSGSLSGLQHGGGPPSRREINKWLVSDVFTDEAWRRRRRLATRSQIVGPTQKSHGFTITQHKKTEDAIRESQNMSILGIEVLALSRGHLLPNPDQDAIEAIFYCFQDDTMPDIVTNPDGASQSSMTAAAHTTMQRRGTYIRGCIAVNSTYLDPRRIRESYLPLESGDQRTINVVNSEVDLINHFIDQVMEWDPDVLTGWELQSSSWGYLADRAQLAYGLDIAELISRLVTTGTRTGSRQYDATHTSVFKVSGRHTLNTWRIMRAELTLTQYTLENVVFHVLHRRIPNYSAETLTTWFRSDIPSQTARVVEYFMDRTAMVLEILDEAEVITKNAEFARVFGVDFFSVLSRGSQFKVESFMSRIAKPESLMLYSPSKEEVGGQNAAECIPLIMEPRSAFYKDPLIVLDFQSLYPSVMIAYNYCYSTCLGRVSAFKGENKFGVTNLNLPPDLLPKVKDHITIAPNGIMYVKPTVRKGLLGKMLTELLDTRVMVKQAMKTSKGDKAILRLLNARQLSLKFICNVTYGYTSASFSGRMPAVEVADSIVQTGRETLEQAISVINNSPKWGAKVVYGDTDSLFVSLAGKTKDQAFRIGNDMADAITALNPRPVKLKFEKVYFPCLLMAKKRYVGFKYEHPDEKEPTFDAKGIETVRRDGIPAGQKMVETSIKILFRTQDLSEVKEYCRLSWTKLLDGQVSIYDFIFAKEVKLGKYSDKVTPPPGVVVAARRLTRDPRGEPQYGDRIPYVITRSFNGAKSRLVDRAFSPQELLHDRQQYQLDAVYYIEHQLVPPLQRVFDLVGADVKRWYDEMPKAVRSDVSSAVAPKLRNQAVHKFTIDAHFHTNLCLACGGKATSSLCGHCLTSPESTIFTLQSRIRAVQNRAHTTQLLCASCSAAPAYEEIKCESLDCRWLFERFKVNRELESLESLNAVVKEVERAT